MDRSVVFIFPWLSTAATVAILTSIKSLNVIIITHRGECGRNALIFGREHPWGKEIKVVQMKSLGSHIIEDVRVGEP